MILERQLAVRLLDLPLGGPAFNQEDLVGVEVLVLCRGMSTQIRGQSRDKRDSLARRGMQRTSADELLM